MKTLKQSSTHFEFCYWSEKDINAITELIELLENKYYHLSSRLKCSLNDKIVVKVYSELSILHKAFGIINASEWIVGRTQNNCIECLSPFASHSIYHSEDIKKVYIHELTHLFVNTNFKNVLPVLSEGMATYEANQNYLENAFNCILDESKGSYLKFDQFCFLNHNNKYLYAYAYSFTTFVVHSYGEQVFVAFLLDNDLFLSKGQSIYNLWIKNHIDSKNRSNN